MIFENWPMLVLPEGSSVAQNLAGIRGFSEFLHAIDLIFRVMRISFLGTQIKRKKP